MLFSNFINHFKEYINIYNIFDFKFYFRTLVVTLYTICLFRFNSSRILGQYSPVDLIITIIIGAILGTAIIGGLPLISSLVSTGFIVLIHRALIFITWQNSIIAKFIKGKKTKIISHGNFLEKNLEKAHLTTEDVLQALRSQRGETNIKNVMHSFVEVDGKISFIMND